ncbi:MAG: hypothetical protein V5783_03620 [Pontiella sp.]
MKVNSYTSSWKVGIVVFSAMLLPGIGHAETEGGDSIAELSTKIQDPLAKIISVPLFFNTYTDIGGTGDSNHALLVQPIIPFDFGSDTWYGITRAIIPVLDAKVPNASSGLGDITLNVIFVRNLSKSLRIGFGPLFQLPTHTDADLGVDRWGAGLSGGAVLTKGRWVTGGLLTQLWDVAGKDGSINEFTFQPIINYDFGEKGGWIFTSTPLITASWDESSSDQWDIPVGGGVSKIFKFGKMPVALSPQAYYHIEGAPKWEVRFMVRLLLPHW